MRKSVAAKFLLVGLIFCIMAIGSPPIFAAATPTYYGYWEFGDILSNYDFVNEGIPTNIAFGRPGELPLLVNGLGYKKAMVYLGDYFDKDRNNNGKTDVGEENYWPIIFNDIARDIGGYESNIAAFYLMDEPDQQAESLASWFNTDKNLLDFNKMKFVNAGDYNGDGKADLAIYYQEGTPPDYRQKIYITTAYVTSVGSGFNDKVAWFDMPNAWFSFTYVKFAVSGDFDGDGKADVAMFYNYPGTTSDTPQKVFIYSSSGSTFLYKGAWINTTKGTLDFDKIKFVNAGDYNGDGKTDLAMAYQEGTPPDYRQKIYVTASSGAGFNNKVAWFDMPHYWFNFNFVPFMISGDYNGDGKSDVAMFYDYPDTMDNPPQRVFVWTSNGGAFQDKGAWLDTTKSEFDFGRFKFVLAGDRGDYNGANLDDISMFFDYTPIGPDPFDDRPQREFVYLSGGSLGNGGFIDHRAWRNDRTKTFSFSCVDFTVSGDFDGDGLDDAAMFYNYPSPADNPPQKIFVGRSTGNAAWMNRTLLERLITSCKNRFPAIATAINFTQPAVMLDKTIPRNLDWVAMDPYPFFSYFQTTYPDPDSWKRYDTWVNAAVRKIQKDMPGKPILIIGQSFRNTWWRIPVPDEEGWYFDTVKDFNLLGLLWFKYNDAIHLPDKPDDPANIYGARNYPELIALHKKIGNEIVNGIPITQAAASSSEGLVFEAGKVVDKKLDTRWSSLFSDPQWIYLDFGYAKVFNTIKLIWETAYGKQYHIDISNDAISWATIYTEINSTGGIDIINTGTQIARYVRLYGTQRGTQWGYSLWEFEVFNYQPSTPTIPLNVDDFSSSTQYSSGLNDLGYWTGGNLGSGSYSVVTANSDLELYWTTTGGWWVSVIKLNPPYLDARSYASLSFNAKGMVGGEKFAIALEDYTYQKGMIPITNYLPNGLTTVYKNFTIPITAFANANPKLDIMQIKSVVILTYVNTTGKIRVDNVRMN